LSTSGVKRRRNPCRRNPLELVEYGLDDYIEGEWALFALGKGCIYAKDGRPAGGVGGPGNGGHGQAGAYGGGLYTR